MERERIMTCKELNKKLLKTFPILSEAYYAETSWQEGDDTGSHLIFEDVFVPFIQEQFSNQHVETLTKIFDFIENLLALDDSYINEVITFSVLEPLIFTDDTDSSYALHFSKPKTLSLIAQIVNANE